MITKQYSMKLQEELRVSTISTLNSSSNAVAINISSKQEVLSEIYNKDKLQLGTSQISNKAVKANTTDVIATDMVIGNVEYYFKHKKLSYPSYTIAYNANIYEPSGQLMYSTERYIEAELKDSSGNTISIIELEFVPVFVDKRMINLKSYIDIDGKYFTPKKKDDKLLLSFSHDISNYYIDNSIFKSISTIEDKFAHIELSEFLCSQSKTVDGTNTIIEYNYFSPTFTLVRKTKEVVTIDKTGYIYLSNKFIDISSIKIISVNNISHNIDIGNITSHSSGKICISELIKSNIIVETDVIEIEYNFLYKDAMFAEIDIRKLNKDSRIHTYVGPTRITRPSEDIKIKKSFGAFVSQNNFLIDNVFSYTDIDISQSGSEYLFDYTTQNQIVFNSANKIESFYANNIGAIDSYLNSKHYKDCGVFAIEKNNAEYQYIPRTSVPRQEMYEPEKIMDVTSSIVVIGNSDIDSPAGIKKTLYPNAFPIKYNIDHKTSSSIYLKININEELSFTSYTTNTDIIDFCKLSDEINEDYSFDISKFRVLYIDNNGETEEVPIVYADTSSNDIYLKCSNTANKEIRLKYSNMTSSYGFKTWKNLYKTPVI